MAPQLGRIRGTGGKMPYNQPYPDEPEDSFRKRLQRQIMAPADLDPSRGPLYDLDYPLEPPPAMSRLRGLVGANSPIVEPPLGQAPGERQAPSFLDRLRGVLGSDRLQSAVAGFGSVIDPTARGVEGFLGSAAQAFTNASQFRRQLGDQQAEREESEEMRPIRRRLLEAQAKRAETPADVNAPRYGAADYILDPTQPGQQVRVVTDPVTGELRPQQYGGQVVRRPVPSDEPRATEPGGQFFGIREAGDLRKEYNSRVERPQIIANALRTVRAAANDPSAAGDLSLIFSYMRMLDPTSAVRETEFANAQNAAGVPDQVRNVWNRLKSGERLNTIQRADFIRQAENLGRENQRQVRAEYDRYGRLARQAGLRPDDVVYDPFEGLLEAEAPAGYTPPPRRR